METQKSNEQREDAINTIISSDWLLFNEYVKDLTPNQLDNLVKATETCKTYKETSWYNMGITTLKIIYNTNGLSDLPFKMDAQRFTEVKNLLLIKAKNADACKEGYKSGVKAKTPKGLLSVISTNFIWLMDKLIINHKLLNAWYTEQELNYYNIYTKGNHRIYADSFVCGNANVEVYGIADVTAFDSCKVKAYDSAQIIAHDFSEVEAYDTAYVTAFDSSKVKASDSTLIKAYKSATVNAYKKATVIANDDSYVRAHDNTKIIANNNSIAELYETSTAHAHQESQIYANNSSLVKAHRTAIVSQNDNSVVKYIEGIQFIC